jgi:hypothetical protein
MIHSGFRPSSHRSRLQNASKKQACRYAEFKQDFKPSQLLLNSLEATGALT